MIVFEILTKLKISLDDLNKCFNSNQISSQLLTILVEQISLAVKECYHATPDSLLQLLFDNSNHSIVKQQQQQLFSGNKISTFCFF